MRATFVGGNGFSHLNDWSRYGKLFFDDYD
jgi:hypothetical protein